MLHAPFEAFHRACPYPFPIIRFLHYSSVPPSMLPVAGGSVARDVDVTQMLDEVGCVCCAARFELYLQNGVSSANMIILPPHPCPASRWCCCNCCPESSRRCLRDSNRPELMLISPPLLWTRFRQGTIQCCQVRTCKWSNIKTMVNCTVSIDVVLYDCARQRFIYIPKCD